MIRDLSPPEALALAAKHENEGRLEEAESLLRVLITGQPTDAVALNRLGTVLFRRRDLFQALYCFERAIKADRRYPPALVNRGMLLGEFGHFEDAEADLRRAGHLDHRNPIIWANLGNTLDRANRPAEALDCIERAILLRPGDDLSYFNRGVIHARLGNHDFAIKDFDRAIELPDARYNRAISMLALGLPGAWQEFESRFESSERIYRSPSTAPRWAGESLEDRTILLWGEQGLGDTIQFLRYVHEVVSRSPAAILLYVHTALRDLCKAHLLNRVEVVARDKDMPAHDYQCPLMSLPTIFSLIPPSWSLGFRKRTAATTMLRVGVCWAGNPAHRNDRNRSIPFAQFRRLLDAPGAGFVGLQRAVPPADLQEVNRDYVGVAIAAFGDTFTDMQRTADVIADLDIVISVDTAVAHLAASMGVETWLLLPHVADWRWGGSGETTPWYPEMKLFRQPKAGDWSGVLNRARDVLTRRATQCAA